MRRGLGVEEKLVVFASHVMALAVDYLKRIHDTTQCAYSIDAVRLTLIQYMCTRTLTCTHTLYVRG